MENKSKKEIKQPYWLIYLSLIISGLLLLGKTYNIIHLHKWTAQVGLALIFSAFGLVIGNGRKAGFVAVAVVWIVVVSLILI